MSFQSPGPLALPCSGSRRDLAVAERRQLRGAVPNLDVLATVVSGARGSGSSRRCCSAALASLLVALARPQVARTFLKERATVILVIDTSRSMQAEDVPPTRLAAAQEAVRSFLDLVPDKLRVGLVVFAGEAQVATPPTQDHDLVRTAVDEIDSFLIYGGTAIGDALQTAVEMGKRVEDVEPVEGEEIVFLPAPAPTRSLAQAGDQDGDEAESPVSILFLSDGAQTRGILQPMEGAALAEDAGFPVYTVALGTPNGTIERGPFGFGGSQERIPVPPDPETLRAIAETTGGEFTEARTAEALEGAYSNLGSVGAAGGEVTFLFVAAARCCSSQPESLGGRLAAAPVASRNRAKAGRADREGHPTSDSDDREAEVTLSSRPAGERCAEAPPPMARRQRRRRRRAPTALDAAFPTNRTSNTPASAGGLGWPCRCS
jgi:Ca-activated chloride channel family protein